MTPTFKPYICSGCTLRLLSALRPRISNSASIPKRRQYSIKPIVKDGRRFRMALIGSGPASFYTAYKVMSKIDNAVVDMYEQLPVPYGLVRFGVAPDHPEVKNCKEKFREVAQWSNFNFIGNISIGSGPKKLPLSLLVPHYDAVLFAYGASKDRTLGITGEATVRGVYSARAFVGWYNGLPEYANLAPDLSQGEEAVVIGQGNVALDVARILLSDVNALKETDITQASLEALSKSRVKRVRVVGRRGPMQAAFTIKEARELMNLPSVAFSPIAPSLIPPELSKLPRAPKRIMQLLSKGSATPLLGAPKLWSLDFLLSPTSFNGNFSGALSSISFEETRLEPNNFDPTAKATGTGQFTDLPASIAFRSIGYKSEALQGFSELGIPFDDRLGIIPNDQYGRVMQPTGSQDQILLKHIPGMYCAGWVRRGPTGVIASTMNDAFSTADTIAEDWHANKPFQGTSSDSATRHLGWEFLKDEAEKLGCERVSWQDWEQIDQAEIKRGKETGKEREKFTSVQDMLNVLHKR